ncbi:MAG TPA: glutaredoxin domain-containing protein [Frankiaceae bacterium]|nr:glutaredoxin domain-containing protein [Frankiaceae bacterium]
MITMYGTQSCGDCVRAKRVFADKGVEYAFVDVEQDPDATAYVMSLNDGRRTVPTIVFPDGSVLAEPSSAELAAKLAA